MRPKLGGIKKFNKIEEEEDSATLLREIKGVAYEYDRYHNASLALDDVKT